MTAAARAPRICARAQEPRGRVARRRQEKTRGRRSALAAMGERRRPRSCPSIDAKLSIVELHNLFIREGSLTPCPPPSSLAPPDGGVCPSPDAPPSPHTITRDFVKHYSMLYGGCPGVGTVSPSASRRQPSPRITSRPQAPGHPPARAGPRLSRPLGRNPLSAGEWSPLGVLGPPGAPGLLTKRGKEDSTQGGTTHSNHKQYQEGGPSERPRTGLRRQPCISAHVCHAGSGARHGLTLTPACRSAFGGMRSRVRQSWLISTSYFRA